MPWRKIRYLVEYVGFRLVVCVFESLSARHSVTLSNTLALVIHRWLPRKWTRYEVAQRNIRASFGNRYSEQQIDTLIFRMWVHLIRLVAEIVHLPRKLHLHNIHDVIVFRNQSGVLKSLCSGRPVILLSGHFGNWEAAIAVFGLFGFPMGVVARELDNPYLNDWFRRFREHTGHRLIAKKGGFETILDTLEQRNHLALLGDQDAGRRGLFVDFFGRPASTFKSIALMALQYDALICVGTARRLPDDFSKRDWVQYELACDAVIDPHEFRNEQDALRMITQQYTSALEAAIRRSPEQYFWLHRRWKSTPQQRAQQNRRAHKPAA